MSLPATPLRRKDRITMWSEPWYYSLHCPEADTECHSKRSPDDLTDQVTRDSQDPVASGGFADIYRGSFQENGVSIKVRFSFATNQTIDTVRTGSHQSHQDIFGRGRRFCQETKGNARGYFPFLIP